MPRLAALVLCTLAALVATATPAPDPSHWVTGWDKAVDPKGDCKFERKGDRLTITVPGEGHDFVDRNIPRLLRDVEGDFMLAVRVSGKCWHRRVASGLRRAGIVVMQGEEDPAMTLDFQGQPDKVQVAECGWAVADEKKHPNDQVIGRVYKGGPTWPPRESLYLRLERRGDWWRTSYSQDGEVWLDLRSREQVKLPRKLKVGVYAEADTDGTFKVVFDKFRLTRPAK